MTDRVLVRLNHIRDAILNIRSMLRGYTAELLESDHVRRAAFERFLEVISEASRHIPDEDKAQHPDLPWRQIADLGNHLRHAYERVDASILWEIYAKDLDPLDAAVTSLLEQRQRLA